MPSSRQQDKLVIRSYHRAFEKDRRLHSIPSGDKPIVLPFEDGLPVRAFGYTAVLVLLALGLLRVPLIGELMRVVNPVVWVVVVPVMLGIAGSRVERDGLALHRWAELQARHRLTPRVRHGNRAVRPAERAVRLSGRILIGFDHHGEGLRPARLTGPGHVAFGGPVAVIERRRGPAVVRPVAALTDSQRKRAVQATAIDLDAADTLEIRP